MRIAIAGAGFGGIGLAMRLVRAGIRSFTLFERGDDVGGTWRENTYPGAACDIPSHLYSFSFEPKADWTRTYSAQPEILDYLRACVRRYGLDAHLRLKTGVRSATFDDARALWLLELDDGTTAEAEVFVSAVGQLNQPSIPALPGAESFAGESFHSARWRHDVDLRDKRVAVIGTGASAIQFVPRIAPLVRQLTIYQRSAPYVLPKADRAYGAIAQTLFRRAPFARAANRLFKYLRQEVNVIAFAYVPAAIALPRAAFEKQLAAEIPDPDLRSKLTPDYTMGCKRVLLASDYYPALLRPNVEVVTDAIARVTPQGIVTAGGTERAADAIVYGTGFAATEFLAPMHVRGRNGRDLNAAWQSGAQAYLGLTVPGFPNFFMIYGPNTNLGHNSIIYMIEAQLNYVLDAVERLARGDARTLEVRADRDERFNARLQRRLGQTVWAAGCGSWYLNAAGRNVNNWPDFTFAYRAKTRRLDPRDYLVARG